jgi:hypothetical protein
MTGSDRQRSDAPCYGAVANWAPVDAALDRHGRFELALEVQVRVGSLDPEMVWEMTFGIYLIAKGFTSPANAAAHRRAAHSTFCRSHRLISIDGIGDPSGAMALGERRGGHVRVGARRERAQARDEAGDQPRTTDAWRSRATPAHCLRRRLGRSRLGPRA